MHKAFHLMSVCALVLCGLLHVDCTYCAYSSKYLSIAYVVMALVSHVGVWRETVGGRGYRDVSQFTVGVISNHYFLVLLCKWKYFSDKESRRNQLSIPCLYSLPLVKLICLGDVSTAVLQSIGRLHIPNQITGSSHWGRRTIQTTRTSLASRHKWIVLNSRPVVKEPYRMQNIFLGKASPGKRIPTQMWELRLGCGQLLTDTWNCAQDGGRHTRPETIRYIIEM